MKSNCEICQNQSWKIHYFGKVRDGGFGNTVGDATVYECTICQNRRLEDKFCVDQSIYETAEYRQKLNQDIATEKFHETHETMASYFASMLSDFNFEGKVIADVGCGGGHLLDAVGGKSATRIAIEPTPNFHPGLRARGYKVFDYAENAVPDFADSVDFAFSQFVIEHVVDPVAYLRSIYRLLNDDGIAVICTPNADDIMLELMSADYPQFFYRTVHRYYFNQRSLIEAGQQAGFQIAKTKYLQRYKMDNALLWLRDKRPSGNATLFPIDDALSNLWKRRVEDIGRADCIYMIYKKSNKW